MKKFDESKSLEALENEVWPDPSFKSSLVEKVARIRKKPVKDLTVEELRLMLGQEFSLDYVIPSALTILEVNPLSEGDFYPGDLLVNLLSVKKEFWGLSIELYDNINRIIKNAKKHLIEIEDEETRRRVENAILNFEKIHIL